MSSGLDCPSVWKCLTEPAEGVFIPDFASCAEVPPGGYGYMNPSNSPDLYSSFNACDAGCSPAEPPTDPSSCPYGEFNSTTGQCHMFGCTIPSALNYDVTANTPCLLEGWRGGKRYDYPCDGTCSSGTPAIWNWTFEEYLDEWGAYDYGDDVGYIWTEVWELYDPLAPNNGYVTGAGTNACCIFDDTPQWAYNSSRLGEAFSNMSTITTPCQIGNGQNATLHYVNEQKYCCSGTPSGGVPLYIPRNDYSLYCSEGSPRTQSAPDGFGIGCIDPYTGEFDESGSCSCWEVDWPTIGSGAFIDYQNNPNMNCGP